MAGLGIISAIALLRSGGNYFILLFGLGAPLLVYFLWGQSVHSTPPPPRASHPLLPLVPSNSPVTCIANFWGISCYLEHDWGPAIFRDCRAPSGNKVKNRSIHACKDHWNCSMSLLRPQQISYSRAFAVPWHEGLLVLG